MLPTLASQDLYVEGEDRSRLQAEAELVLANIEQFVAEAAAEIDVLRARVRNILGAIRRAQRVNGGVVIW